MDYSYYIWAIKENLLLEKEKWFFKSDHRYNIVLEHVSQNDGLKYLEAIKNDFGPFYEEHCEFLVKLAEINDQYGRPNKFDIPSFSLCSPTNLRYIYQSCLALQYINQCGLNDIDFIEIGGGYGGLCYYIHSIAPIFGVRVGSYAILDLEEAQELQKRYLQAHNIELSSCLKYHSFLISNYAFSELSDNIRSYYTHNIINRYTDYGFLAWNFIPPYNFTHDNVEFFVIDEKPKTAPTNKFVYFKPMK